MVLCRSTNHGWASDVDLLNASIEIGAGRNGLSKRVHVDTIVQAHVGEQFKGRVFTFYDMGFNGAFVTAGVLAAFVLPPTGLSMVAFLGIAAGYLACAAWLSAAAHRLGHAAFERGTGGLTAA